MNIKISDEAKKAIKIGTMCFFSYLSVYIAKNILSAVTPQMIEGGSFKNEHLGTMSSIYFTTYALGQLINGRVGDKIKGKYMISFGLFFAGICCFLFALMSESLIGCFIVYGMMGIFLSMIFGPMSKIVAENTEPIYATRCTLGYTFASFLGTPMAGVLASLFLWRDVFNIGSVALIIMGVICFAVFTLYEKKGIVEYNKYKKANEKVFDFKVLIENRIIKFTMISILTGIVRTTVVFWMPTYISQHLGFSPKNAALIFTVATFVISATAFVAIFLYERLNRNMDLTILIGFSSSAICFILVFLLKQPLLNIIFLILAIMSSNTASAMLWSRYCPSLRDTGMVSTATGFLDFISYMAAAVSTTLFANAVADIGWGNLILIWFGLMIIGVIISLPRKKNKV